ncbi:MAG: hypothetical protein JWM34_1670 [Ilumatobacteraceae bacterium]|nr:hypothetical protein [Ilumatobacteraceae bacterium]
MSKVSYPLVERLADEVIVTARNTVEAQQAAGEAMGGDCTIVSVERVHEGGIGGFFATELVRVTARPSRFSRIDRELDAAMTSAEELVSSLRVAAPEFADRLMTELQQPRETVAAAPVVAAAPAAVVAPKSAPPTPIAPPVAEFAEFAELMAGAGARSGSIYNRHAESVAAPAEPIFSTFDTPAFTRFDALPMNDVATTGMPATATPTTAMPTTGMTFDDITSGHGYDQPYDDLGDDLDDEPSVEPELLESFVIEQPDTERQILIEDRFAFESRLGVMEYLAPVEPKRIVESFRAAGAAPHRCFPAAVDPDHAPTVGPRPAPQAIDPRWSHHSLRAIGLPDRIVDIAMLQRPVESPQWIMALMAAFRTLCNPTPNGPTVLVGPSCANLARQLKLVSVGAEELSETLSSVAIPNVSTLVARNALNDRNVHVMVGGDWEHLASIRPHVVSAATESDLLEAVRVCCAWDATLGWTLVDDRYQRIDEFTLVAHVRTILYGTPS